MPGFVALAVEDPVRDWLGDQLAKAVHPSNPPSGVDPPYPVLSRLGGGPEGGHMRVDAPVLTVECWGKTWESAEGLAAQVVTAFEGLAVGTVMGPLVCLGAEVIFGPVRTPSPGRVLLRYVVDVAMRVRPV